MGVKDSMARVGDEFDRLAAEREGQKALLAQEMEALEAFTAATTQRIADCRSAGDLEAARAAFAAEFAAREARLGAAAGGAGDPSDPVP